MSRFYASIEGNRGEATRQGTAKSGMEGHLRGWHVGCRVVVFDDNGQDTIKVYKTGGSSGLCEQVLIAKFTQHGAPMFFK